MLRVGWLGPLGASLLVGAWFLCAYAAGASDGLRVGLAAADVTPELGAKPVWLAGFGKGRRATAVHDPIMARALVLEAGGMKIALVSVDVVGLFHEVVERVRGQLPGFAYVLVSSTHNHEGPDTLGLWGANFFQSGIDPDYLKRVEAGIVQAVRQADASAQAAQARLGTARAPELLHDGREPYVKHDELVALRFVGKDGKNVGVLVQWNCHPETLDSKNTEMSADFVAATVEHLQKQHGCPVVYLTGTVGGLMTSLHVEVKDENGKPLADGTFTKTERYGQLVGKLADRALAEAAPVVLTPFEVRTKDLFLPLENTFYQMAWKLGVLQRRAYAWSGDPYHAEPSDGKDAKLCIRSEVGWLRLGALEVAAIPGEIYPELVLGQVQDPPDPGADFPDAPIEPAIYAQLKGRHRMLIGLANDELGYILPKRQWDEKAPYCYGRTKPQYGEVNSVGPSVGPIICAAFRALVSAQDRK
jgi:hypothetical protein